MIKKYLKLTAMKTIHAFEAGPQSLKERKLYF